MLVEVRLTLEVKRDSGELLLTLAQTKGASVMVLVETARKGA